MCLWILSDNFLWHCSGQLSTIYEIFKPAWFWCNWFFYLMLVPMNYEFTKPRALFFVLQSYLARLAKCYTCILQKYLDFLIKNMHQVKWKMWRFDIEIPKWLMMERVRQTSKTGLFNFGTFKMWHSISLICHGLFVSNISSDEKKHANKKKKPTPYLEFNKILHLILFSFFEKFNMNTQVLHSFKLCWNCWSGSCAAFMCQVPREGTLKAAVIQIIPWDCPDRHETSVWQVQHKNRDRNCLSWGLYPPDLWFPQGQVYVFEWSDTERMG